MLLRRQKQRGQMSRMAKSHRSITTQEESAGECWSKVEKKNLLVLVKYCLPMFYQKINFSNKIPTQASHVDHTLKFRYAATDVILYTALSHKC